MLYMPLINKRPTLKWDPINTRQKIIQRRINRLLKKFTAFYLIVGNEEFFIDGGRWIYMKTDSGKYNKFIGHAKNFFPFIETKKSIPWGSWRIKDV